MGITDEDRGSLKGSSRLIEPVTGTIQQASQISGLSRSRLYLLLGEGQITAVKDRGRTLVRMDSLRLYLDNLPAATFRASQKAA